MQATKLAIVILIVAVGVADARAQSDTITLTNGDRLTGEIKSLDRGMIRFKSDATDTITIRWDYVAAITSEENFQVELDDGRRLLGSVDAGTEATDLRLLTGAAELELPTVRVVRMTPIEGRLVDRIDLGVDLGYSFTKASNVAQANIGIDFGYRSEQHLVSLNTNTARTLTDSDEASLRSNASFAYRRFRSGKVWDPVGLAQIERNDQLGIRRRRTAGGGMARWLVDTNERRLSFAGGLVTSSEDAVDVEGKESSLEAVVDFDLDWFRYENPEFDISAHLMVFERLSGSSRTRGNLDVDFRWELLSDFDWGFSIYYSFDSNPETVGAENTDYGVVTSLGWDF
jgi:sRNA-binding regulator protein Hfq